MTLGVVLDVLVLSLTVEEAEAEQIKVLVLIILIALFVCTLGSLRLLFDIRARSVVETQSRRLPAE